MRWIILLLATVGFGLVGVLSANAAPAGPSGLEAGLAVVDITPPIGYRMSGYFRERFSTGTHDPLLAKAVVLRQGDCRAALVFCDLIGIPLELSRQVRSRAEQKLGIPAQHILIAATHTHTGPLYFGVLREYFQAVMGAKQWTMWQCWPTGCWPAWPRHKPRFSQWCFTPGRPSSMACRSTAGFT